MLPKKFRLSKKDFEIAFKKKGYFFNDHLIKIKIAGNNLKIARFGVVVGLKISKKATQRNRLKRQISEILRIKLPQIKKGYDLIILPQPLIIERPYQEIKNVLTLLLKKANLL